MIEPRNGEVPPGMVRHPLYPNILYSPNPIITRGDKIIHDPRLPQPGAAVKTGVVFRKAKEPGLATKALNYGKAKLQHIAAGSPECTDEQVQERHAICKACPSRRYIKIDEERGKCALCGCGLMSVIAEKGDSKLRWAEQECPAKHWSAISPPAPAP